MLALAWLAAGAGAQSIPPGPGNQGGGESAAERLDFKLGPFRISPYLQIGQIAADTNVFYTAEGRRTDIVANGGPGLRIALPVRRLTAFVDGGANYYWFARSREERRFGGDAGGGLNWKAGGFSAGISRFYRRSYDRPSIEVDRRVLRENWTNHAYLNLDAGARLRLEPSVTSDQSEVPVRTDFLGTDLRRALTQNRYSVQLEVKYRLTPKTDFVLLADNDWNRFPEDERRDSDSNRVAGGFQLTSATRLSGRLLGGARLFRPRAATVPRFWRPYVEARIEWILGDKTRLGGDYRFDTGYSAFSSAREGRLPTTETHNATLRLRRRIGQRVDFDAEGRLTKLSNDGPVLVRRRGEEEIAIVRDDEHYSARADLGFRILNRLRLGVVGSYGERRSNIADFGVDGLLLGASIRFNP